jgi:hypothetical protein
VRRAHRLNSLNGAPNFQVFSFADPLGMPVIDLDLGPGFENGTRLWYYILAESSRIEDGRTLGPVGSRIVGESFYSVLERDASSYVNTGLLGGPIGRFRPRSPDRRRRRED